MSKKTKLAKILAAQRRTQQISQQLNPTPVSHQYVMPLENVKKNDDSPVSKIQTANYNHVTKDLLQTFVLTVLAIAAQLCVYYLIEVKHFQFKF